MNNFFLNNVIRLVAILLFSLIFTSCKNDVFPKPKAYLRLAHQPTVYKKIKTNCPFEFEIDKTSKILINDKCWVKIKYPKFNAIIDITYVPVNNNLRKLLLDTERLTTEHSVKADKISFSPLFENFEDKVYGRISDVVGNAASPLQFYITDSVKNFITGAVYFNVQPNYDSIYPSVKYIEKDLKHLIETTKWKE